MNWKNKSFKKRKRGSIYQNSGIYLLGILLLFVLIGFSTTITPAYRLSSQVIGHWTDEMSSKTFLYLLGMENKAFKLAYPTEETMPKLSTTLIHLVTNMKPTDPRSLFGNEFPGFRAQQTKIIVAGAGTNYTNLPVESSPPLDEILQDRKAIYKEPVMDDDHEAKGHQGTKQTTGNRDVVLLYNTHNTESFMPYLPDVKNTNLAHHGKVNVGLVSKRLGKALEDNGIGTHVDHTNIARQLSKRHMKYVDSYKVSREVVETAMKKNKDLQYMFDIHRDGNIPKKDETITIKGQDYARIIFVVGADYHHYEKNLALATKLNKLLEKKYPGLSRGVIAKKQGNGVYNQDLSNHALLIEFGGVHSKLNELYRSADIVADIFSDYYWDAEKVDEKVKEAK